MSLLVSSGGVVGPITASDITDSSASGRTVLTGTAAEARAAIGAAAVNSPVPGIVLIGSSTFAYEGYNALYSKTISSCRGCLSNGLFLSGARAQVISNLAVVGSSIADHDAQFATALALNPQCIAVQSFTNDVVAGVTAATMNQYLQSWASQCAARGIHLIVRSSHWRSMTAAQMKEFMKIRQLTRQLANGNTWVSNVDGFGDLQDDTSLVGAARANYLIDGIHPSNLGAYINGRSYAALFEKLFPPLPYHWSDAYDENYVGVNWLRNPSLCRTGGTLGANCSGEAPLYWVLDIPTVAARSDGLTTTVAGSIVTDTDGRKAFQVTITNGIAGDVIRVYHPATATSGAAGDYAIGCKVRMVSGEILAQPEWASLNARCMNKDYTAANNYPLPADGQEFTYSQYMTVAASQPPSAYLYLYPRAATAGNAVVLFKSPYLRFVGT